MLKNASVFLRNADITLQPNDSLVNSKETKVVVHTLLIWSLHLAEADHELTLSNIVDTNFTVGTIFGVWPGDNLTGVTGGDQVTAALGICERQTTYVIAIKGFPGTHNFLLLGEDFRLLCFSDRFTTDFQEILLFPATVIIKEKVVFPNGISPSTKAKLRLLFELCQHVVNEVLKNILDEELKYTTDVIKDIPTNIVLGIIVVMDTLSEVSEYLNNLEAYLDDRDSSETKMGRIEKSEEELEMFEALEHKNGQEAWDAELDLAYSHNYIMDEMLGKLGFVRLDYGNYGRRMVKEVRVEIHGFNFLVDFMVIDYANKGEMRIDITMLEDDMNIDTMLASLVEDVVKVRSTSDELVKMGKANRNKSYNVNKLTPPALPKIKEIPPISSTALPPVYHPLSPKHKEKILEALDRKYKELEEQKPIVEVLENYMVYRKKLDEVMMGRARLENKEFSD
ncbi:reverse transcriptase domain-containing protein, partial [Tanacetum coccineum]